MVYYNYRDDTRNEFVVDPSSSLFETAYLGGLPLNEVSDSHVIWEPLMLAEFERFHRYHPQMNKCSRELYAKENIPNDGSTSSVVGGTRRIVRSGANIDDYSGATAYPFSAKEYKPERGCSSQASSS